MAYNIDPELLPMLELVPPMSFADPAAMRRQFNEMAHMIPPVDETGINVYNRTIPGPAGAPDVPIRIYRPWHQQDYTPGLIYIHGGGFVIGNLDTEHGSAVSLCRDLGIVIVSVDYRLAPEHPYPAGLEDCYAALLWTAAHADEIQLDVNRLGVTGMSAGGGLAAALTLLARDRAGPALCFQCLGIPELDDRLLTRSMKTFTDTPMWNRPNAELSWKYYLEPNFTPGAENVPEYAAPARALDLRGLPPAFVSTMEFDPLRDEGILYAMHLLQAGVQVELHCYPGTFHGSSLVVDAATTKREAADIRTALRRGLRMNR